MSFKSLFSRKPKHTTVILNDLSDFIEASSPVATPDYPERQIVTAAEVKVGRGYGKAVIERDGDDSITFRYVSNFGASFNAGPLTLTQDELVAFIDALSDIEASV